MGSARTLRSRPAADSGPYPADLVSQKELVDFGVGIDDVSGARKFSARQGIGDGDYVHAGGARCGDAGGGIFDDAAVARLDVQEPGGVKKNIRGGFAVRHVRGTDAEFEMLAKIF